MIPDNLKYSKEHEWVKVDGDTATIGITDYAQGELGDVVFVELPPVGKALKPMDEGAVLESVKTISHVYSPVSGTIAEVNSALATASDTVNKDPYGAGWIFKVKLSNAGELGALLDAAAYKALTTH